MAVEQNDIRPKFAQIVRWFFVCLIVENILATLLSLILVKRLEATSGAAFSVFFALCQVEGQYMRPVWFGLASYILRKPTLYTPAFAPIISLFFTYGSVALLSPIGFSALIAGEGIFDRLYFYKITASITVGLCMFLYAKSSIDDAT